MPRNTEVMDTNNLMNTLLSAKRSHRMAKLLSPQSIAVIGASGDAGRIGGVALDLLVRFGFEGEIYPVNPRHDSVFGLPCHPDLDAVPGVPDLAVIAVRAALVPDALRACHAKGIEAALVYASGFSEESPEGAALEREIATIASETGLVVAGPNCMGNANFGTNAITAFATILKDYPPVPGSGRGRPALLTQSGNLCAVFYALGRRRGLDFSHFINTGNETVVTFEDYLTYLVEDNATSCVIGYVEGLRDGPSFRRIAARFRDAGKPLILIKSGESERGADAARSHTAALSGDRAVYRAAFRDFGVMRADDPTHLMDLAYLAGFAERTCGPRAAVTSISGAMGALMTDLLGAEGVQVPELSEALQANLQDAAASIGMVSNPIDYTGQLMNQGGAVEEVLGRLAESGEVDFSILYGSGALFDRIAEEAIRVAGQSRKLIVAIDGGISSHRADLEAAGIPVFDCVARAVKALAVYLPWRSRLSRAPVAQVDALPLSLPGLPTNEHECKALLRRFGIGTGEEHLVVTKDQAGARAESLGGPVAMKMLSADIAHKTEVGGVRLNVTGRAEATETFETMMAQVRALRPDARLDGILMQRMETGVAELLVGVTRDPVFGPVLTVGAGGVLAELLDDAVHALLPVDESKGLDMLKELKIYPMLTGFRSGPPADIPAICKAIAAVSRTALALGDALEDLEINPLLVKPDGEGVLALDALCTGRRLQADSDERQDTR